MQNTYVTFCGLMLFSACNDKTYYLSLCTACWYILVQEQQIPAASAKDCVVAPNTSLAAYEADGIPSSFR